MHPGIAVVFGSSGLIGREVVSLLEKDDRFKKIILPVRRLNQDIRHDKIHQVLINFDDMEASAKDWTGDVFFFCLGTTMAKAKSREAFYKVDYTYTCAAAAIACRENPAAHVLLVSSMGADVHSLFYYSRVKGEAEKTFTALPCAKVSIFRPSLLLGNRTEKRAGEEWAARFSTWFSFLFNGPFKIYRPIEAVTVAKAMVYEAGNESAGKADIFSSEEIESRASLYNSRA